MVGRVETFAVHGSLFTVHRSPFTVRCLAFAVRCLAFGGAVGRRSRRAANAPRNLRKLAPGFEPLLACGIALPPLPTQPKFSPHRIIDAVVIDLETDFFRYMLHGIVLRQDVSKDESDPFVPAYLDQARQQFCS